METRKGRTYVQNLRHKGEPTSFHGKSRDGRWVLGKVSAPPGDRHKIEIFKKSGLSLSALQAKSCCVGLDSDW